MWLGSGWWGLLLLANAWDAGSARLVESLGGKAVATTSAGVAWAWGYKDGHALPLERLLQTASAITRAIDVPLTLDMERGFGNTPEEVTSVARLGVAGINIEEDRAVVLERTSLLSPRDYSFDPSRTASTQGEGVTLYR
ncbi:hypothetical protein BON30_12230 [Cystobacter ferrugineus]|uniref:Uncharacterized protein n=1 Tax=Cystobacter ferrugineus TaxID=83449 RepID=A0A1L9BCA6_9BACT|nr:hypothetical protein BON30_12230 [Cystobacter ferrugineus]